MKSRLLHAALAILFLLAGAAHGAGEEAELKRLQSALNVVNQEIQAAYQQFQVIVEARRDIFQMQIFGGLRTPDVQNFDLVQQEQREAVSRDRELMSHMNETLARIRELEARKQPILERIYRLVEEIAVAAPQPVPAQETPAAQPIAPPRGY